MVAVLLAVLGISTFFQMKEKQEALFKRLHHDAEGLTQVINTTVRGYMVLADIDGLRNVLKKAAAGRAIKSAYILNSEGKVFISSEGSISEIPGARQTIEKARDDGRGFYELRESVNGIPYMMGMAPIRAGSECAGCHSDVKKGDAIGYLGLERWAGGDFQKLKESFVKDIFVNILAIAALIAAVILIMNRIAAPLSKIAGSAARIAEGDIDQDIEYHSKDEVGVLADSFRGLVEYIRGVAEAASALSRGELEVEVEERSEKDLLSRSFRLLIQTMKDLIAETGGLIQGARRGRLDKRGDPSKFKGGYQQLVQGINETLDTMIEPTNEATEVLERMAARDLSVRMKGDYRGEHARLKDALNGAVENLDEGLSQVAAGADQVASAAIQISNGSQSLAQGAAEQASSLEEVSSNLQEMASMTKQNSANAQEARGMAEGAHSGVAKGMEIVQRLSEAMSRIKISSGETAKIVKTIDEIAFQTNLLALNAAVEAARAGEAGKGFAVVADEVRNLAMRSAEAAKSTASMIDESVKNAEEGVLLEQEVLENFQEINDHVNKVSEVMIEIAAASEQQSQGIDQVNIGVDQMNNVTQQNAANSEESSSAAQELSSQAEQMRSMVASFNLSDWRHSENASIEEEIPSSMERKTGGIETDVDPDDGNGHFPWKDSAAVIPFDKKEEDKILRDF